jgi:hypothetical protein
VSCQPKDDPETLLPFVAISLPFGGHSRPRPLPKAAHPLRFRCQDVAKKLPFAAICCHFAGPLGMDEPVELYGQFAV